MPLFLLGIGQQDVRARKVRVELEGLTSRAQHLRPSLAGLTSHEDQPEASEGLCKTYVSWRERGIESDGGLK